MQTIPQLADWLRARALREQNEILEHIPMPAMVEQNVGTIIFISARNLSIAPIDLAGEIEAFLREELNIEPAIINVFTNAKSEVEAVIRLLLQDQPTIDGGAIEAIVDEDSGHVALRLLGSCRGCPISEMEFTQAFPRLLPQFFPWITSVSIEQDLFFG